MDLITKIERLLERSGFEEVTDAGAIGVILDENDWGDGADSMLKVYRYNISAGCSGVLVMFEGRWCISESAEDYFAEWMYYPNTLPRMALALRLFGIEL